MKTQQKPNFKEIVKHISFLFRKYKLDYEQTKYVFKEVRKRNNLSPSNKTKKVTNPLTPQEMSMLWDVAYKENSEHGLLLQTLFFTGARNNEFCNIKVEDCYLDELKIHIREGKGSKERFVPIAQFLCNSLRMHIKGRESGFLFESRLHDKYSPRRIQDIVKNYGRKAGISKRVYPHLLRHSIATYLREKGWPTDRIAVFLGHADSKVTERVYAKVGFPTINKEFQMLMEGSKNSQIIHLQHDSSSIEQDFSSGAKV